MAGEEDIVWASWDEVFSMDHVIERVAGHFETIPLFSFVAGWWLWSCNAWVDRAGQMGLGNLGNP